MLLAHGIFRVIWLRLAPFHCGLMYVTLSHTCGGHLPQTNLLCWGYLIMLEPRICLWNCWFPGLISLWGRWQEKRWLWTKVPYIHPLHSQQAAFQVVSFMARNHTACSAEKLAQLQAALKLSAAGKPDFKTGNQFTWGGGGRGEEKLDSDLELQLLQTTRVSCYVCHCLKRCFCCWWIWLW